MAFIAGWLIGRQLGEEQGRLNELRRRTPTQLDPEWSRLEDECVELQYEAQKLLSSPRVGEIGWLKVEALKAIDRDEDGHFPYPNRKKRRFVERSRRTIETAKQKFEALGIPVPTSLDE